MQNLQDLQEKIFFESKNILETLSKINSKEDLLAKQDLFAEVADRIAFLRILEKNKDSFLTEQPQEYSDTHATGFERNSQTPEEHFDDSSFEEDVIEEEVMFTNEINAIQQDDSLFENSREEELETDIFNHAETPEILSVAENIESTPEENNIENEAVREREIPLVVEQEDPNYKERVFQKEQEFLDSEERRRKIVEINKHDVQHSTTEELIQDQKTLEQQTEKKFKLSNIKGLKAVQNLFDEDPLEKIQEKKSESSDDHFDNGSLLKTNIPTDFMEAPKKQHEFKLDFNDKIAFTKLLFNGDENELKITIDKLNSFQNMEEARQYLSEVYYQRDWSKVDEYAQRLWDLVENKLM